MATSKSGSKTAQTTSTLGAIDPSVKLVNAFLDVMNAQGCTGLKVCQGDLSIELAVPVPRSKGVSRFTPPAEEDKRPAWKRESDALNAELFPAAEPADDSDMDDDG